MIRRKRVFIAAALGAVFIAGACASVPDERRFTYVGPLPDDTLQPDFNQYKAGVDDYLGRRCATLDCHGQIGRPLRIFSQNGLRGFDAAAPPSFPNVTGRGAVTEAERRGNFLAVVGLEPEIMARVIAGRGVEPNDLLLLKKPRALGAPPDHPEYAHKGGQLMVTGDDGYKCITSWLAGSLDTNACEKAASIP